MKRLPSITVLLLLALAAPAAANPVNVGSLDWANTNVYTSPCASSGKCTFLGFTADPRTSPGAANGTAFPDAPATGPTVTTATPQNDVATFSFPGKSTGSTYDPATRTGTLEYDGTVHFKSTKFGFDITLDDPQVVLTGDTGKLYASGTNSSGAAYDRSTAVFDLDLSGASVQRADNTVTISGIAPSIAARKYVFFDNYDVGAGPDRSPNTFGSFSVTARLAPNVSVTPATALNPLGQTVTVSGTDASTATAGLYVYLSAASASSTDTTGAPAGKDLGAFSFVRTPAGGTFTTTISARSPFTTGAGTVDCALVPCVVRTIAAHFADDRTQDTATPVTFTAAAVATATASPVPTGSPAATVSPSPPPTVSPTPYAVPATPKPRLTKITLTRRRVGFTLSRKAKVTGTIKRRGKVVRRVKTTGRKGRTVRRIKTLRRGRYRVTLKPKNGTARTKVVRFR